MEAGLHEQVAFYLTDRRPKSEPPLSDASALVPALFARYRDLTRLRYDFPLVLVDSAPDGQAPIQPLTAVVNELIRKIAHPEDHDRVARHLLRLEQHIREAVAAGVRGPLSTLWSDVAAQLGEQGDATLADSLARASAALAVDGEVIDCRSQTPERVIRHLWSTVERVRLARTRDEIDQLILKLSDILRVDFERSDTGRSPDNLKATVGTGDADLFDFDAMSRLLRDSLGGSVLTENRRKRIEYLIHVLRSQRFVRTSHGNPEEQLYSFAFAGCEAALAAYRERLPQAIELTRAIAIARLEIKSEYNEDRHDTIFEDFGVNGLDDQEMARFPRYLLHVDVTRIHGDEYDSLMEILEAGLPVKVLLQTNDLLAKRNASRDEHLNFGTKTRQITHSAMGLNEVFVLQASASHLNQARDDIVSGLRSDGPALFSIFSGATDSADTLPPYLIAAAAMECRAFPAFIFDPSAGSNWAERFSVKANPHADADWPVQLFTYEDENHQRIESSIPFSPADFIACDRRFSRHFLPVQSTVLNGTISQVPECLDRDQAGLPEKIPSILMVDRQNRLHRVVVDDALVRASRRCREYWHSLQELGGIHNSHAERLLAREREVWEEHEQQIRHSAAQSPQPVVQTPIDQPATPGTPTTDTPPVEPEPAPSTDEPYIETARCTSCNECIQINSKMFAYDENKQCHIVDLTAGTYRDLVEAAENCQVAIIHPGMPRNPNESGLDDLLKRAEMFV